MHLGRLAGRDLAARCREGRLDTKGKAGSREKRKRALTAESSARWAGAITRTSENAWQLADRNLKAERASLAVRVKRIESRIAVAAGHKQDRIRGYKNQNERHAKTIRLKTLSARATKAEQRIGGGTVSVTRGGRKLLRARQNLADAGLTEAQWRDRWESSRLFLTADGEADTVWGSLTIRWNPDESWVEVRLPRPLEHLANRPAGRYRLSCPVDFPYRGDEVAAQAATGAVRYDISHDPETGRWYLDASWKTAPAPPVTLAELRQHPVIAVDLNAGHLAVAVLRPDGNVTGTPFTIPVQLGGLPAATRDGRLRAAVSLLVATAKQHGARAIVIEDLNFAVQRAAGREHTGNRPSRGRRGRRFRHLVAGIPTAKFRDRLVQMTFNAGLRVIVVDPAYTSRWGAALARAPAGAPPWTHQSPCSIGGDRQARAGPPGQAPREREPGRSGGCGQASPGAAQDHTGGRVRTKETCRPTRHPAAQATRPARLTGPQQATRQPRTVRGHPPSRGNPPMLSVEER